jgi:hypothetical protein
MSNNISRTEELPTRQEVGATEKTGICSKKKKGWLKGGLTMGLCCAVPLLLVAAIALFGISLGALASGFLSLAALLACPVGMYLMMRMMMKEKKEDQPSGR